MQLPKHSHLLLLQLWKEESRDIVPSSAKGCASGNGVPGACSTSSPVKVRSGVAFEDGGGPAYFSSRHCCRESWLTQQPGPLRAGLGQGAMTDP